MSEICVVGLGGYSVFLAVDHFNAIGETVKAGAMFVEAGGKGYNQAVAAARLGAKTSFVGAFGKDSEGKFCVDFLKNEGIEPLVSYKDEPSAYACILTDSNGENRVTVYGGAAAMLTASDIEYFEENISSADVVILQNEVPFEANQRAAEISKKHGKIVILNPAPAFSLNRKLLESADIITPNLHEAVELFGDNFFKQMKLSGVKNAVVTLGADGCDVLNDGTLTHIDAIPTNVLDTTGAGDCFNGALAVGMAKGMTLVDAAAYASKVASVAVSKRGAVGGMPYIDEI